MEDGAGAADGGKLAAGGQKERGRRREWWRSERRRQRRLELEAEGNPQNGQAERDKEEKKEGALEEEGEQEK